MRHLNLNCSEVPHVSPANPTGDGHNDERHNDNDIANDDNPC